MTEPFARPSGATLVDDDTAAMTPRAFAPALPAAVGEPIESLVDEPDEALDAAGLPVRRRSVFARIAWATGSLLVAFAIGLAIDRLVRDLFAANPWLGWAGAALAGVFAIALLVIGVREYLSLRRLRVLDRLRERAREVLISDRRDEAVGVLTELSQVYAGRPDLARSQAAVAAQGAALFDGAEMIRLAERQMLAPLDQRARALTAGAARRVALVTAISPRALVDVAFVAWESFRLAGAVARLYGARPGLLGALRLAGEVLSHLAVTGGLALGDGAMEQLIGQGLAARISARLGEGLVNGLMTARVGIAAIRVARPLPFDAMRPPLVRDFIPELVKVAQRKPTP